MRHESGWSNVVNNRRVIVRRFSNRVLHDGSKRLEGVSLQSQFNFLCKGKNIHEPVCSILMGSELRQKIGSAFRDGVERRSRNCRRNVVVEEILCAECSFQIESALEPFAVEEVVLIVDFCCIPGVHRLGGVAYFGCGSRNGEFLSLNRLQAQLEERTWIGELLSVQGASLIAQPSNPCVEFCSVGRVGGNEICNLIVLVELMCIKCFRTKHAPRPGRCWYSKLAKTLVHQDVGGFYVFKKGRQTFVKIPSVKGESALNGKGNSGWYIPTYVTMNRAIKPSEITIGRECGRSQTK